MKTPDGVKVIEFNARFGDPETEVVLPLMDSDICDTFMGIATGEEFAAPVWSDDATLGVVLASKGYPGSYDKGFVIGGVESLSAKTYHMGTARRESGELVTAGGRVMIVVARAATLAEAHTYVAKEIEKIECENLFHRNDIGYQAFKK